MYDTRHTLDLQPLRSALQGQALAPGQDGWDAARHAWNLAADQHPAVVAYAASATDVAAVIRFARERGLRVAAQGTGHGATALRSLEDTVLLKTMRLRGIEIDAAARRARVEAGVLWGDVAVSAGEAGLAALHGTSPDTGVVGYTLGGGLGWLARRHGLASNSVVAIELVMADGHLVRVHHDHEPELFWALRGGGGSFGVVTAIEFGLYPVASVYAGMLAWPAELGGEVGHAYREWTQTLPEELTSEIRFITLPPIPEVPEPLRGRKIIEVSAAYLGDAVDGQELMAPLREIAPPLLDTYATMPAPELRRLAGDPEQPTAGIGDQGLVRELTPDAMDAFIALAGPASNSSLLFAQLRHLGGALSRPPDGHGALATLDGEYVLVAVGVPLEPGSEDSIRCDAARLKQGMSRWMTGHGYLNFADQPGDTADLFPEAAYGRLRRAKASFDPEDLFRSNHPVAPA